MSTTTITATPADGWLQLYAGATASPIAVEKASGTSSAYLAIGAAAPDIAAGHAIANSELKNVILGDGESLYVRCVDALSPTAENLFIITD
ncbi:hypothetical protein [Klebsiella aerogenes]|uniref:hypothetical protein n=1 Tax=Klebsiella aerogenes TaxID=548 RepID=UPI00351D7CCE